MTEQQGTEIVAAICKKHNANEARVFLLTLVVAKSGFGRNTETMNALRAVADIIDTVYAGGTAEGSAVTEPSAPSGGIQGGYLPPTKGRFQ